MSHPEAAGIIPISDRDDPRIAPYRDLRTSRVAEERGWFIAEGENLVLRLAASNLEVISLLAAENRLERLLPRLPRPVTIYTMPEAALRDVAGFDFHRGVLGCGRRRPRRSIRELLPPWPAPFRLVILAGVADAENLGAILRTSAALGADGVLLGPAAPDPWYRRVVRVSMGALFTLPLAWSADLQPDLEYLAHSGVELYATVLDSAAQPLSEVRTPPRWALVLGSESSGIPASLRALCGHQITLPMHRQTDSLNVSVAAGIFLHHFMTRTR